LPAALGDFRTDDAGGRFALRHDTLTLALVQFVTCGSRVWPSSRDRAVSLAVIERAGADDSVARCAVGGIAYTDSGGCAKVRAPSHAAVIFSMEACSPGARARETLSARALSGCALIARRGV